MKGIHWFRQDLRVQDNPALSKINEQVTELLCVYVIEPCLLGEFDENIISTSPSALSNHRQQFLAQSLKDLQISLNKLGQKLHITTGEPIEVISSLVSQYEVDTISSSWHCGFHEQRLWQQLVQATPQCRHQQEYGGLLYHEEQFPFALENMPDTFSPFRKKVEKYCELDMQLTHIDDFASPVDMPYEDASVQLSYDQSCEEYTGGSSAGIARIQEYLWQSDLVATYKQTRNGLDGWDFSTRLSAWLANGSISAKQVMNELNTYEQQRTKNDSTYWVFFELLWREFFHWQHAKHGALCFVKGGMQNKSLSTSLDKKRFEKWRTGTTGYPIVDACMRQLITTGFMSNRGRQLVASCFVHELDLDWRYGAAFFEHHLVDFDVASNFGNWQYLAGVGADPRGHRQFNLEKQTMTYDPQRIFINKWLA